MLCIWGTNQRWSPAVLGSTLLAWWDAERTDLVTTSGGNVSSWKDSVGAYDLTQATSGFRPTYSATSFNGKAGVTFDGSDDYLGLESVPGGFPTGAASCEIWALVQQDALVADTTGRVAFNYGGAGGTTKRSIERLVNTGVNHAASFVGTGAASRSSENATDFSSRAVLRLVVDGANIRLDFERTAGPSTACVPGTTSVRTRMGTSTAASPTLFWNGKVAAVIVTSILDASQAEQMYTYLLARK